MIEMGFRPGTLRNSLRSSPAAIFLSRVRSDRPRSLTRSNLLGHLLLSSIPPPHPQRRQKKSDTFRRRLSSMRWVAFPSAGGAYSSATSYHEGMSTSEETSPPPRANAPNFKTLRIL